MIYDRWCDDDDAADDDDDASDDDDDDDDDDNGQDDDGYDDDYAHNDGDDDDDHGHDSGDGDDGDDDDDDGVCESKGMVSKGKYRKCPQMKYSWLSILAHCLVTFDPGVHLNDDQLLHGIHTPVDMQIFDCHCQNANLPVAASQRQRL